MLVHRRVTPSSKFAGTHAFIHLGGERHYESTSKVSCPRTQHSALARDRTRIVRSGVQLTNKRYHNRFGLHPADMDPQSNPIFWPPPQAFRVTSAKRELLTQVNVYCLTFIKLSYDLILNRGLNIKQYGINTLKSVLRIKFSIRIKGL